MKVFTRIEYEDCSYIKRIPVAEPSFGENERRYLNECLSSGWISSQGLFVERFERELAEKLGVPEAVAVSSGTAALHLAVAALGIGPGDEVIVPDLTFAATINSVLHCGATPVLVDVDVDSWTMLPSEVESAITARTRAVLPVHLYGQMAAMDELIALARRHNLLIIEDAAQALGSRLGEQLAGTIGDAGAFSMFANKLISTGEGGMIIFRDAAAAARARVLRDHGMTPGRRYWHDTVGFNYRLTNLQAAIGVAQLERFDYLLARKRKIANAYHRRLADIDGLILPARLPRRFNSYWQYSLIIDGDRQGIHRDEVAARLDQANIETRPLFYPLHIMPPYRNYARGRRFPNTEWLSSRGLSLPSSARLRWDEIDFICGVLRCIFTKVRFPTSSNSEVAPMVAKRAHA
jgi:perosamine synthetase